MSPSFASSPEFGEVARRPSESVRRSPSGSPRTRPMITSSTPKLSSTPTGRSPVAVRQGAPGAVRRVHADARSAARARRAAPISCHATPSPAPGPHTSTSRSGRRRARRGRDLVGGVLRRSRRATACEHGGTVILNPTNGSSYTGTILQSQQVAASRLRAIENGRWVVQVSPTGFSAFVIGGRRGVRSHRLSASRR